MEMMWVGWAIWGLRAIGCNLEERRRIFYMRLRRIRMITRLRGRVLIRWGVGLVEECCGKWWSICLAKYCMYDVYTKDKWGCHYKNCQVNYNLPLCVVCIDGRTAAPSGWSQSWEQKSKYQVATSTQVLGCTVHAGTTKPRHLVRLDRRTRLGINRIDRGFACGCCSLLSIPRHDPLPTTLLRQRVLPNIISASYDHWPWMLSGLETFQNIWCIGVVKTWFMPILIPNYLLDWSIESLEPNMEYKVPHPYFFEWATPNCLILKYLHPSNSLIHKVKAWARNTLEQD
jgi:hypothetical protein